MFGAFLIAQAELAPKFQPGPARLPDQVPITRPEQLKPDDNVLEDNPDETAEPEGEPDSNGASQQLKIYQQQEFRLKGNTVYNAEQIQDFIRTCNQNPSNLSQNDWAALCITLRYQKGGYINTRVYSSDADKGNQLDVVEGRLVELRVNGPNESLNARTEQKLSALKQRVLNANDVLWALQLVQQQPGAETIRGRLGRVGSDASQSSLIVKADPKGTSFRGLVAYDNEGKISAGENRNQAILTADSVVRFADRWMLYADKTWIGAPQTGSSTYSVSYVTPFDNKTSGTLSLGFSKIKPIEFGGIASEFRTNQFQITGLISRKIIDSYDRDLSLFGQYSFTRSNLYFNGEELPSIVPDLIRRPQNGYIKLGLEANKVNRRSIHNAQLYISQATAFSFPMDQIQSLDVIGISPDRSNAVGASISNLFLLNQGIRIKATLAGQKSLGVVSQQVVQWSMRCEAATG